MAHPLKIPAKVIKSLKLAYKTWRLHRTQPLRLEFVVTDTCNLNCKGCTHYSPLAPKEFESLEAMTRRMAHLGEVCGNEVKMAYLIGGETLLYPWLVEAMKRLRECFPTQKLCVFTNGIALPKMTEDFWEAARKYDYVISLTRYPINFDYDAVEELCREKGVKVEIFGDRSKHNSFFRFALDPEKKQNGRISHFKCYNRGCISVVGERVYPCSISGCVGHLNKAKGTDFKHEPGDWIEVKDVKSAKDIYRLRDRVAPFCSYCILPPDIVKHGPSSRDVSEWVKC